MEALRISSIYIGMKHSVLYFCFTSVFLPPSLLSSSSSLNNTMEDKFLRQGRICGCVRKKCSCSLLLGFFSLSSLYLAFSLSVLIIFACRKDWPWLESCLKKREPLKVFDHKPRQFRGLGMNHG